MHLRPGCTGRIGKLVVVQRSGDGVKVAEGVHDLVVGGGSIRCLAKAPDFHQDGIQVLGGARITFRELTVSCGRRDDRLINSNLFIKQAGKSQLPPRDVVCENCSFGGWAAHTVSVQTSVRSGVTGSKICVARFPQFTLAVGDGASDPRVSGNHVRQCSPGKLTVEPGPRTVEFGERLRAARALPRPAAGSARGRAGARARDAEVRARRRHAQQAQRPLPAHRAPADRRDRAAALGLGPRAGAARARPAARGAAAPGAVARGEGARGPFVRRPDRGAPGPPPRPAGSACSKPSCAATRAPASGRPSTTSSSGSRSAARPATCPLTATP